MSELKWEYDNKLTAKQRRENQARHITRLLLKRDKKLQKRQLVTELIENG